MIKKALVYAGTVSVFILCLTFRAQCASGIKSGLDTVINRALPSLFPYLFFSGIIADLAGNGTKGGKFFPYMLGVLCGFPIGAKMTSSAYKSGITEKKTAEKMLFFTNVCGVSFIFSVCGGILGNKAAWIIFGAQFILTFPFSFFIRTKENTAEKKEKEFSLSATVIKNILSAGKSFSQIAAFILFFSFISEVFFAVFNISDPVLRAAAASFFEICSGFGKIGALPRENAVPLAFFAVGTGGVSVLMQSIEAAKKEGLSVKFLIAGKLYTSLFMTLIGEILRKVL